MNEYGWKFKGQWFDGKKSGKFNVGCIDMEYAGKIYEDVCLFVDINDKQYSWNVNGKMKYKNGDIFDGQWVKNLKQNNGRMTYKNGDKYDGEWTEF